MAFKQQFPGGFRIYPTKDAADVFKIVGATVLAIMLLTRNPPSSEISVLQPYKYH